MASSEANAEDVLQQALLQAWAALCAGAKVREAGPWLYRIVHNLAASDTRQAVPRIVALHDVPDPRGTDHEAELRIDAHAALKGIAALPLQQRQVMVGTAVEGLSHEEVARELGLSSGAVRGLIYRARATLRAAAAAFLPGPVLEWVARQGSGAAGASGVAEAIATGSGSAGLGGLLLKGGAIAVTAGAFATATGITVHREFHGHHQGRFVVHVLPAGSGGAPRTGARAAPVSAQLASSRAPALPSRAVDQNTIASGLRVTGRSGSGGGRAVGARSRGSHATVPAHDPGRRSAASRSGGAFRDHRGSGVQERSGPNGPGTSVPAGPGSDWSVPARPRSGSGFDSGSATGRSPDSGAVPSSSGAPSSSGLSDRYGPSTSYGSFGWSGASSPSGSSETYGRSTAYTPDASGGSATRMYAPMSRYDSGGVSRSGGSRLSRSGDSISNQTSRTYGGSFSGSTGSTSPSSPMTSPTAPTAGSDFRSGTP